MSQRVNITFSLDAELVRKVKILLMDPKFGRVKYGAFSGLVESHLRKWLEAQQKGSEDESRGNGNGTE